MSWPDTLDVNGTIYSRETMSDGWVYRVTGVTNPHFSIHGVVGKYSWGFDEWKRDSGGFHLRYGASGRLWEYNRGEPDPFMTQGGGKTTNKGAEEPQANALAKAFWQACDAHGR